MTSIQVRTFDPDADPRQINAHRRTTATWADRRAEVQTAVTEVVQLVVAALDEVPASTGWQASKVETTFGVTVLDRGGVLLSDKGDTAALQVHVTFDRTAAQPSDPSVTGSGSDGGSRS